MQGKEIPEPKRGSRQLKAVVLKALSFDREKRYRSGKEMLEALLEIEKLTKAENARAQKVQEQNVQAQNAQDQKTQGQESLTERTEAQRQKKAQAQNISQEQEMQRGSQPENQITAEENAWRIAYAENLLRQSEWYRRSEFFF